MTRTTQWEPDLMGLGPTQGPGSGKLAECVGAWGWGVGGGGGGVGGNSEGDWSLKSRVENFQFLRKNANVGHQFFNPPSIIHPMYQTDVVFMLCYGSSDENGASQQWQVIC